MLITSAAFGAKALQLPSSIHGERWM